MEVRLEKDIRAAGRRRQERKIGTLGKRETGRPRRHELRRIERIFQKNRRPNHEQCPAEPVDDSIEHAVEIDFRPERSAKINQRLAQVVPVAIEKFVEPDLELIFDRSKQQCRHDGGDNPGNHAQRLESRSQKVTHDNNDRRVQPDHAGCRERVRHTPFENDIDIHQPIPMNGIAEGDGHQHKWENCKIDVRFGHQTQQTRD